MNDPVPTRPTLKALMGWLVAQGCVPGVYRRGPRHWRAHVNMAGNYWDGGPDRLSALRRAVRMWDDAGRPMDGMAVTRAVPTPAP